MYSTVIQGSVSDIVQSVAEQAGHCYSRVPAGEEKGI